jgi:hypothetical protein
VLKSYTSERQEGYEFEREIDGEKFVFRPKKKSSAFVRMLTVDRNDDTKAIGYAQAQLEFLEDSLDRTHRKTKKQPGHGQDSVEGCQACRMYDRLNDDDDPLALETLFEVASDLMGDMSSRPTG